MSARHWLSLFSVACVSLWLVGCEPAKAPTTNPTPSGGAATDEHDHEGEDGHDDEAPSDPPSGSSY